MYCRHCGKEIGAGAKFCPGCGARIQAVPPRPESTRQGGGTTGGRQKNARGSQARQGAGTRGGGQMRSGSGQKQPRGRKNPRRLWLAIGIPAAAAVVAAVIAVSLHRAQPLSEKDLDTIASVNRTMDEMRSDPDYLAGDVQTQAQIALETVNSLAEQGLIEEESILYDDEEKVITYTYPNGIYAFEKVGGFDEELDLPSGTAELSAPGTDAPDGAASYTPATRAAGSAYGSRAVILNAMTDRSGVMDRCNQLMNAWNAAGVTTTLDTDVTLDDMASLQDYSFVYGKMHGLCTTFSSGRNRVVTSCIYLEQRQNSATDKQYEKDLLNHYVGYGNGCYTVMPEFITEHYRKGDLDGNIFFFGCCQLMGKGGTVVEGWPNALQSCSAASFVGFHNSNYTYYNLDLVGEYMNDLLQGDASGTAFDKSLEKYGANDEIWYGYSVSTHPAAYPLMRGNGNALLEGAAVSDPQQGAGTETEETAPEETQQGGGGTASPAAGQEERYGAFAEILLSYEEQYGKAEILTWEDLATGMDDYPHSSGVYFAKLVDFDGNGAEELVIGFRSGDTMTDSSYSLDVWEYLDHAEKHSLREGMLGYGVDSGSISFPTYEDGTYLAVGLDMKMEELALYGYSGGTFGIAAEGAVQANEGNHYYFDYGKGAPLSQEDYMIYGLSDWDRSKLMDVLHETKIRLGLEEGGAGVSREVELRRAFQEYTSPETMLFFLYDDFDGDGSFEAFAATEDPNSGGSGRLYYVSSDGEVSRTGEDHELWDFLYQETYDSAVRAQYLVDTGTQKFFVWEGSAGGSGSTSYIFGVRNGAPYEPLISGHAQGFCQEGSEYVSYESDFSQGFHDYVRTLYSFQTSDGEFYPDV